MAKTEKLISYLVLAGVAGYCLYDYYIKKGIVPEFPYATFTFTALHGLIGSMIYLRDSFDNMLLRWLYNTEVFIKTISLPCFVTEIWLKYGVIQPEAAWIHAIVGAVPAAIFVFDDRLKRSWIDMIVYLNTLSLAAICVLNENHPGLTAAGLFTTAYYIHRNDKYPLQVRPDIWFNYLSAAFTFCALLAICY